MNENLFQPIKDDEREDCMVIQKDLGSRKDFLIVSTFVFVFHCSLMEDPRAYF